MKLLSILIFILLSTRLIASEGEQYQTVRGRVYDKQSRYPLSFVTVRVKDSDPLIGSVSDEQGYFSLKRVPLGRKTLIFSFTGYKEMIIPNLLVTSGKEVVLEVSMEESVTMMDNIVVTAGNNNPAKLMNEMATVSARAFNVEETQRYAGSRNDPARMAANFAGVSGANDGRNDIIIRGNSPTGLLWRLEGLDIPNPNHFAAMGTTGGPVSILNNNLLSNSEFYTGAFPSMYGNAISGVFDLQMRNGNSEKHEFLGQIGFNGLELGAEGPLPGSGRGSYLLNYRYSIPAIFQQLGLSAGTGNAVPYYQDLSFKVNIPTPKGKFSVFGIGGISHIDLLGSETTAEEAKTDLYSNLDLDIYNYSNTGVAGASYLFFINKDTYWNQTLAWSGSRNGNVLDTVMRNNKLEVLGVAAYLENDFTQNKYTYNTSLNHKLNAKNTFTTGIVADLYQMNLTRRSTWQHDVNPKVNSIDFSGNTMLWQGYLAWQHKFSEKLLLNAGMHYQQITLNNNSKSLEPRLGLQYTIDAASNLSLAYGRHSQMQALQVYFIETVQPQGTVARTNRDLGFTISNHFVVAYDRMILPDLRLKAEAYYQDIMNVPVTQSSSAFSMLNAGADFFLPDEDSLVNKGTGYNHGLEMTLEKFFTKSYYFLLTGSFFDSKYKGSDDVARNTIFNGNFVVNALFGKEWKVGKKNNAIALDCKFTTAGNRRFIPINLEASQQAGYAVYDSDDAYRDRFRDYIRADLKLSFRKEHKRFTEEYVLDIQNVTNAQNIFMQRFNSLNGTIGNTYQLGTWPMMQYRITF